jgi:hypothetical protein
MDCGIGEMKYQQSLCTLVSQMGKRKENARKRSINRNIQNSSEKESLKGSGENSRRTP